jgi:hypothetical protein
MAASVEEGRRGGGASEPRVGEWRSSALQAAHHYCAGVAIASRSKGERSHIKWGQQKGG